jgi:hypothetical protein
MPKTPEELAAEAAAKAAAEKAQVDAAAAAALKASHLAEHGYPSETSVDDMTEPQRTAYWRHIAKKKDKELKGVDVAKLQADAAELAALKAANATDNDKALEEARREGENIGAAKYLKEAVTAKFQALTGKKDEEVEIAFAHVDALSFVDDKGEIDHDAIKKFAGAFGASAEGGSSSDPVRDAQNRQRPAGAPGSGQSMAERREASRDRMTKKKTPTT